MQWDTKREEAGEVPGRLLSLKYRFWHGRTAIVRPPEILELSTNHLVVARFQLTREKRSLCGDKYEK